MLRHHLIGVAVLCAFIVPPASAQVVEIVGSRALGMGGAFVAVASDGSATWWNPAGLAAGPFFDMALARATTERTGDLPAWRQRASSFAVGTPPVGFGYYRLRITDIQPFDPTGQAAGDREDRRVGVPVRSLSASQLGVTLVHTVIPGVHAGTTLKYLRGTLREEVGVASGFSRKAHDELLDRGDALEGDEAEGAFDLDVGVLAVVGSLRVGAVVRNVREAEFDGRPDGATLGLRLPRQVRAGVALDPEVATGVPLIVALDVDLRSYKTASGDRQIVALGAEQWIASRRIGIRAGGRFNGVGDRARSATAGISVAARAGLYVDGYVVRGGSDDEQGWGLGARVSF